MTVAKDKNDHEGGSKFPFNDSNNVGKRSSGLFIDDPGATVADEKLRFDLSAVRLDAAGNQTVLGTFKYGFDRNGADINLLPVVRTGP